MDKAMKSKAQSVSIRLLRQLIVCDANRGILVWRWRPRSLFKRDTDWKGWNGRYAGRLALNYLDNKGYPMGNLGGTKILAHRVIWAFTYGKWPKSIDHINGVRADNRICNLRIATSGENARNSKLRKNNKSGVMGVRWDCKLEVWIAYIGYNRKVIRIGSFSEISDAIKARKAAEIKYGFHPNHGRAA